MFTKFGGGRLTVTEIDAVDNYTGGKNCDFWYNITLYLGNGTR